MHPYTYDFSLRISHPTNDLSKLQTQLNEVEGFYPAINWQKGDNKESPKGKPLDGFRNDFYCSFTFFNEKQNSEFKSLPVALEEVANKLSFLQSIFKDVVTSGGDITFFIGLFIDKNSGIIFDKNQIKKISDLSIHLEFDIYPPDNEL